MQFIYSLRWRRLPGNNADTAAHHHMHDVMETVSGTYGLPSVLNISKELAHIGAGLECRAGLCAESEIYEASFLRDINFSETFNYRPGVSQTPMPLHLGSRPHLCIQKARILRTVRLRWCSRVALSRHYVHGLVLPTRLPIWYLRNLLCTITE